MKLFNEFKISSDNFAWEKDWVSGRFSDRLDRSEPKRHEKSLFSANILMQVSLELYER